MAANGVVAQQWVPGSMKLDGFEGYDAAREDVHVLAVDDSHVDRKVIERLLKISSFKATVVDSGTRALQFLGLEGGVDSSSVGYNELKVDLIITDYCMPGMTGYELLKKIKESSSFREVPVVIMSSENVMARINRCLEEGAEEFIMKPVKLSDVKRLRNYTTATREVRADTDPDKGTDGTGGNNNPTTNKRKLMEPTDVSSELSFSPPSILSSPSSPDPSSPSISSSATCSPTSSLDSPTRRPKSSHSE